MATQVLLAVSTALTVLVLNLHHRGETAHRPPTWLRTLVLHGLGRLLCVRYARERDRQGEAGTEEHKVGDRRQGQTGVQRNTM